MNKAPPSELEAQHAVRTLLAFTGDPDQEREGLQDTPARVVKAYKEWFSGYAADPADLFKAFQDGAEGYDELVIVSNIPLYSQCEHHSVPFFGLAHVAYLPGDKILGLSKFARLVEVFARRLQVQERLTRQVADCLEENLKPRGVGVVLECRHLCMESRGTRTRGTVTTTSALRGALQTNPETRAEFFTLVRSASRVRDGL